MKILKMLSIIFIIIGGVGTIIPIINWILIGESEKIIWLFIVSLIVLAVSICGLLAIIDISKEDKNKDVNMCIK